MYKSILPDVDVPNGNVVADFLRSPDLQAKLDQPLVTCALTGESYTAAQVLAGVGRYAAILRNKYGVGMNNAVCVFTHNSIFHGLIHMGILSLGAQVSPANVMYSAEELAHQLRVVGPKLLICIPENKAAAEEGKRLAQTDTTIILLEQVFDEIRQAIKNDNAPSVAPVEVIGEDQHAYYCFSSGTTGLPKGVITTHRNINAQFRQMKGVNNLFLQPGNRMAAFLPMSHIYGLTLYLWCTPYMAASTYVFPRFELEPVLAAICKYDIAYCPLVPPIAVMLGKSPLVEKYPIQNHLKAIVSAAAPLAKSTCQLCLDRIPNLVIHQMYGLTESSPFTHAVPYSKLGDYDSSIGWLIPNVRARLVDPITEMDAEPGKPGELWLYGPNIMKGYYKNPEATNHTITVDGWLKTGDVAIIDEKGQFFIVDRIKELIKSKGHQVAPAELEAILLTHPHVSDAAVVGVLDSTESTELPRAFLVLHPGAVVHDVIHWFNEKVAKHKRLWGGAVLMETIPKTASGKILRRHLRDRKEDEVHHHVKPKL